MHGRRRPFPGKAGRHQNRAACVRPFPDGAPRSGRRRHHAQSARATGTPIVPARRLSPPSGPGCRLGADAADRQVLDLQIVLDPVLRSLAAQAG
jgi:hypothetical protein